MFASKETQGRDKTGLPSRNRKSARVYTNARFPGFPHFGDYLPAPFLLNQEFRFSQNDYDWLGEGVYFWEANPLRGLQFAQEIAAREPRRITKPCVIGAILDLGYCPDLTTNAGLGMVKDSHLAMKGAYKTLPPHVDRPEKFLHPLDCAVINYLHEIRASNKQPLIDSIKAIFQERPPTPAASTRKEFPVPMQAGIASFRNGCLSALSTILLFRATYE